MKLVIEAAGKNQSELDADLAAQLEGAGFIRAKDVEGSAQHMSDILHALDWQGIDVGDLLSRYFAHIRNKAQ